MTSDSSRTPEGAAATDLILQVFRVNGLILTAGGLLAAEVGLSPARWQVLGAVALAGRPLSVSQIARRMGLTRQSVQASVNQLVREALLGREDNPDHRRSPLIRLTETGSTKYEQLERRQVSWINELVAGLKGSEVTAAALTLQELSNRLDTKPAPRAEGIK